MALSDEDRARIREEEWIRLQTAEEFRRALRPAWLTEPRAIGLGVFGVVFAALLFALMRSA